ncbi:MAG: hypothetical protein KDM63_19110 [Verrucomicrobiae bacterium]|nr:hypothetical protein [Verrucomicrobiae bacterium]
MRFYPDHRLIAWWPEGVVSRERVIRYYEQLAACEWGDHANRFCDFSKVTDFGFDVRGLGSLAAYRKRRLESHREIKLVIYSSNPLGFGMARVYQSLVEDLPLECFVETSLDRCAEHLGIDRGLIEWPGGDVEDPTALS